MSTVDKLLSRFARAQRAARQRLREEALVEDLTLFPDLYETLRDDERYELPWEQDAQPEQPEMSYVDDMEVE